MPQRGVLAMSPRIAVPLRALARRAAAHRRLVAGLAAGFTFAAILAAGFLIEARARAADSQNFRTPTGGLAAFIDAGGNLALRGSVYVVPSQAIVPPPEAWVVRSPNGTVQASLDLRDDANGQPVGTLCLRADIMPNTGAYLDAIDAASGGWKEGMMYTNTFPPWTLRDSKGRLIAALIYNGALCNLVLRGSCFQDGQDAPIAAADNLIARPLVQAVRLDFTASTADNVSAYQVLISTTGPEGPFTLAAPQSVTWLGAAAVPTSCNCTGLTAGTRYHFQVRPVAEGFVGLPSNVADAVPFSQCQQPWPEGWR